MKSAFNSSLIYLLFIAFIISLSAESSAQDKLRVMSYNIRYDDKNESNTNSWKNRRELVASVIRFHSPDIIGVQEALLNQLEDLTAMLPDYKWIGVGRDDGNLSGEFSAVLYKHSEFKVLDYKTFWLSQTPDKVSMGWDAVCKRIITVSKILRINPAKEFYFLNTHLDHVGIEARKNSASFIINLISELEDIPLILTGDFNSLKDSDVYHIITNSNEENNKIKLYDSEDKSVFYKYGSDITYNGFSNELIPGNKIDYIFINDKVEVIQHAVIGETFNGKFPSDHMPVVIDVILK
ncbi:MAG: endonuclease/exonuclease/phosphatase family protein [Ignavibacteriaceae bacterium]|nr:endonuclease/exonuclease/phosphatase family protein [Ignavibacteriaceae bacterium]